MIFAKEGVSEMATKAMTKPRTLTDVLVDHADVGRKGGGHLAMRDKGEEILALARVLGGAHPSDTGEDDSDTGALGFSETADDVRARIDALTDMIADMHAVLQREKTNPTPLAF
jgi:hypothetical protein